MADGPLGALTRYTAHGVFGSRTIDFELSDEGTTILTGANGTGKSTVLRSINAISKGDLEAFFELPLTSVVLLFPKRRKLQAEKTVSGVTLTVTGEKPYDWKHRRADHGRPVFYSDAETLFTIEDMEIDIGGRRQRETLPAWVRDLRRRFPVLYVTDQRLVVETTPAKNRVLQSAIYIGRGSVGQSPDAVTTRNAVDDAAKDIAERIERAHTEYGLLSQAVDHDFADRVVETMESGKAVTEKQLRELVSRVDARRNALQHVGLLPEDVGPSGVAERKIADGAVRAVVAAVHEDTLKKLAPLEALREPLAMFLDFLNPHYSPRKKLAVDKELGIVVTSNDGIEIPPAKLSSGEQQILVLAHHVLFKAQRGTTVLIDEPELSLHVTWQDTLLDDLVRMAHPRDLAFLMATHSPTLLGGRKSIRRSLDFD